MRACERGGGGVCAARDRLASRLYGCRVAQIKTLVRTAARSMPRRRPPPRRCLPPRPRPGLACALRSPAHRPARAPPYVAGPLGPPATGLRPLIPRPPLLWGGYHYAAQLYWNAAPRLGPVGSYPGSWCAPAALGAPRRACLPAARRGRLRPDAVGGPYPVPPSGLPGAPPRISASPGATAGSANSAMPAATAGGVGSTPASAAPPVAAMKQLLGSPSPATRSASTPSCGRRATCQRGCARWRSARVAASVCLAACLSVRQWVCVSTRPSDCSRPWVSI